MSKETRLNIKDINDRSTDTEVLHVQDKLVRERIDAGMNPATASKLTWREIRERTGRYHKQAKVQSP